MTGRYRAGPVPTSNLPNTQRFLRDELQRVGTSIDDAFDLVVFLAELVAREFVYAGYGGVVQIFNSTIGSISSNQWVPYDAFILDQFTTPKGVVQEPPALRLLYFGIWNLQVQIRIEHNTDNGKNRLISLRLVDLDDGNTAVQTFRFTVPRAADETTLTASIMAEIGEDRVGHLFGLEIGGGDSFSSVVGLAGSYYQVFHVSEYNGGIDLP